MAPRPREEFTRLLRRLDHDAFEALLRDLWAARGRDATLRDGRLVVANADGSRRFRIEHPTGRVERLLERAPATGGVDGVITSRRTPAYADTVPGDVIAADDLYDMVYYAVGEADRERLFRTYFGRPASVPRTAASGSETPDRVALGAGVVLLAALLGGVVVSGALPGSPAGIWTPTATPVPTTAAPASPTAGDVTTDEAVTPEPTERPLLGVSGRGERARTEFIPTNFTVDERVTVIQFKHQGPGPYSVWVSDRAGNSRRVIAGNGSANASVLLDLDRGEYDLHVLAENAWTATVRLSDPPEVVKNPYSIEDVATVFGGPLRLGGAANLTVYGLDPTVRYRALLNTRQGGTRTVLANTTGNRTPVTTDVTYRGTAYIEVTSTGDWRVVIRRAG